MNKEELEAFVHYQFNEALNGYDASEAAERALVAKWLEERSARTPLAEAHAALKRAEGEVELLRKVNGNENAIFRLELKLARAWQTLKFAGDDADA